VDWDRIGDDDGERLDELAAELAQFSSGSGDELIELTETVEAIIAAGRKADPSPEHEAPGNGAAATFNIEAIWLEVERHLDDER
jgi:hypothetical protein